MNQRKEDTALGVARARFVDSLPKKAEEIEASVRAASAAPDDAAAREDLRKRFHALYASAQVFRIQELAEALKGCLVVIDEARDEARALAAPEVARLREVLGSLSELATGQRPSIIPNMDDAVENSRYTAPRPSALGLPPAPAPRPRSASSPGVPAAPPRPVSSPGVPAARPRSASSPGVPAAPPRPVSSPGIPAAPPRPVSSQGIPAAPPRPASSPGFPAARPRATSSPAIPSGGGFPSGTSSAKSSAFVPRSSGSIPPARPTAEKRLVASRSAATVEVDRVLFVLMVGGEPIAQRLATVLPKSRVEIAHSASEREAVDVALERSPDVVVVAPSFAPLVADAFAEAALDFIPRVQLTPPGANASDYQLESVTAIVAVNAPPSKMAKAIVDAAAPPVGSVRKVSSTAPRRAGDLGGVEVVVAFDEPGVTHFIARELERDGATVYRASDGERALALVRATRPAVVLTCAALPALDGATLVRRVERDPSLTSVRVFVLDLDEPLRAKMRALPEEEGARVDAGAGHLHDLVFDAAGRARRAREAMAEGREHRARLRGIGVEAILEELETRGADARVELRETERTLEVEVRGGQPVIATFTASSGDFVRGDRAFERLATFAGGRFAVAAAEGAPKGPPVTEGARARLAAELLRRSVTLELIESGSLSGETRIELDVELAAVAGLDETLSRALGESKTIHSITTLFGPERARDRLLTLAREGAIVRLSDASGTRDLVEEGLARRGEPNTEPAPEAVTTPGEVAPAVAAESEEVEEVEDAIDLAEVESEPPQASEVAAPRLNVDAHPTSPRVPFPAPSASATETGPATPPPLAPEPPPSLRFDEPMEVPKRKSSGWLVAILAMLVVAGAGFAAVELFGLGDRSGARTAQSGAASEEEGRPEAVPVSEKVEAPAPVDPFPAIARFYGERRVGITDPGVKVPEGQGLVVVEEPASGPSPEVFIGNESLGKAPVSKAFPVGRVEITFVRGAEKTFRYVFVEPGVTRVLSAE